MMDRLIAWIKDGESAMPRGGGDELQLAVAALLLEAAVVVDGDFDPHERRRLRRVTVLGETPYE